MHFCVMARLEYKMTVIESFLSLKGTITGWGGQPNVGMYPRIAQEGQRDLMGITRVIIGVIGVTNLLAESP